MHSPKALSTLNPDNKLTASAAGGHLLLDLAGLAARNDVLRALHFYAIHEGLVEGPCTSGGGGCAVEDHLHTLAGRLHLTGHAEVTWDGRVQGYRVLCLY
jgi:hypothetical protein